MVSNPKRVHFDEKNLTVVINFTDSEENVEQRKCYWEFFARDRYRFRDRIGGVEEILSKVLASDHRQYIFNQRFLPSFET